MRTVFFFVAAVSFLAPAASYATSASSGTALSGVVSSGAAVVAPAAASSGAPVVAAPAKPAAPADVPELFKFTPVTEPTSSSTQSIATTIKADLKDGTHIEIDKNGAVTIVASDGSRTPAPDGVLTLRDGTTFEVKDGKQTGE